jgi:hypothetical protein
VSDKTWAEIAVELAAPFPESLISWRIQGRPSKRNGNYFGLAVPYIDARNVQDRLDAVVGIQNWRNEFSAGPGGGVLCGLSIRNDGEWVAKYDGAENTQIEGVKGGLSDALKRAGVAWGIGRYLYNAKMQWCKCDVRPGRGDEVVWKRWIEQPRLEFEGAQPAKPDESPPPRQDKPAAPPQDDAIDKAKLWEYAKSLGYTEGEQVLEVLEVDAIENYKGTKEQAAALLNKNAPKAA